MNTINDNTDDPAIRFLSENHVVPTDEDRMIWFLMKYGHYPSRSAAVLVAEMGVATEHAIADGTMTINTVDNKPVGITRDEQLHSLAQMCLIACRMFLNDQNEVAS
jgi:hypothetical protein